ncbi:MAG: hypothetical protein COX19_10850 [Desulfobacterales bacterium CG23_combo_of_CG06-09_8_20_14_all_51_8]|nr:MAG: hypothetical protein COX19_10850 [Desulfobacterales bacterium CG23_combo_of_CG06-09_8_20_14_all_51_8]
MERSVEIIMVIRDRLEYTKKAIESLVKQTYFDRFNLTIWDNDSSEETKNYLRGSVWARYPFVRDVIFSEENKPLSEVTNTLFLKSNSDLIGKVDNDVIVPPDWLERCVKAHETYDDFGFIGGFHFLPEDIANLKPKIDTFNGIDIWRKGHIGGCSFIIKRKDFVDIGLIPTSDKILMGLSEYQHIFHKHGKVNGYLWPLIWVDHFEDVRSPNHIDNPEYNDYKWACRRMSIAEYSDRHRKNSEKYLNNNLEKEVGK